ncbi:hypothetical protein [Runella sp. SP2]|uniref:hypothetical protein n=1 Tax=Runella sp. SP2 TaxID=2268026 RepID=UPI000F088838|nr:hypothetical protein [Runella sp. SP2]AYQ30666.1 hypothetical protein DTQ70_00040 [Runella sp. SP2]
MKTPFTLLRSKLQYLFLLCAFLGFLAPSNAQGIHIPDDNFAAAIRSACPTCINAMDTLLPPAASITNLNIENKGIVSLSGLHGFSSLQTLWAVDNQVTVLPTLPNSLTYLGMRGNLLTSLPTLPTGLMTLDVDQNPVTSLPTLPVGLKYLWVQGGH